MNEKTLMLLSTIGGIFPILPIIAWFLGSKDLQGNNRETAKTMVNADIILCVVGILSNLIPVIGLLVSAVIFVAGIILAIKSFTCVDKEAFSIPALPEIIK